LQIHKYKPAADVIAYTLWPSVRPLRGRGDVKRMAANLFFFILLVGSTLSSKALRRHDAQTPEADEAFRNRLQRSENERSKVCLSLILTQCA